MKMQILLSLAQASPESLSSSGFILVAVAAVLGFLLGSLPRRSEMTGQDFDFPGAIIWAVSAVLTTYGAYMWLNFGSSTSALFSLGGGLIIASSRIYGTRPPRTPSGHDLKDGINYATGDTAKAKKKSAERSFARASFANGSGRHAARGREWYFDAAGVSENMLMTVLGPSMRTASSDRFAILVLLVSYLPDDPRGPGVVVINGTSNLRASIVDAGGITPPGCSKIAASTIVAAVGYAWR